MQIFANFRKDLSIYEIIVITELFFQLVINIFNK